MTKPATIHAARLKSFIERIEKLEEERKAIGGDIRDVYSEARGGGYDVKTMRKVIALRKMDAADRDEAEAVLAAYCHALGMPTDAQVSYTQVVEGDSAAADKRAVRAVEMLTNGASIRATMAATGMSHGSVQRLRETLVKQGVPIGGVPRGEAGTADAGTPHNPETGEITSGATAPNHDPGEQRQAARPTHQLQQHHSTKPEATASDPILESAATDAARDDVLAMTAPSHEVSLAPREAGHSVAADTDAEPDRGETPAPRPEGKAACAAADPDPDHGWEGRDAAGNYIEALGAIRACIVASGQARLDAGDIPAFLDKRKTAEAGA